MKSKRNTKKSSIRSRNLSPVLIQNIRIISDLLGNMIPATSPFNKGLSFNAIAKEYKLNKFLSNRAINKKDIISGFIKALIQKGKQRTLKKIISEKLPIAIERRYKNGDPILFEEANKLSLKLKEIGIDLVKEIDALNLPSDRPRIIPPTQNIKTALKTINIHQLLLPECEKLFNEGNLNESVRKALEKLENYTKQKSGVVSVGTDLMASTFNQDNPILNLYDKKWDTKRQKGLQDGFKLLNMGLMGYWKNFLSHGDEDQIYHHDALAVLGFVSSILFIIDNKCQLVMVK